MRPRRHVIFVALILVALTPPKLWLNRALPAKKPNSCDRNWRRCVRKWRRCRSGSINWRARTRSRAAFSQRQTQLPHRLRKTGRSKLKRPCLKVRHPHTSEGRRQHIDSIRRIIWLLRATTTSRRIRNIRAFSICQAHKIC